MLRGNIRVLCRVRPAAAAGNGEQSRVALSYPLPGALMVQDKRAHEFEFDAVLDPSASQA